MSVSEFSAAMQSEAYKQWFKALDKNIVNSTVDKLRASQQKASKTDFLITATDIGNVFKAITGSAHKEDIQSMLEKIADNSGIDGVKGAFTTAGTQNAVLFKGIGFDTITEVLNRAFSSDEIDHYLYEQTELHKASLIEDLKNDPTLTKSEYNKEWQKIDSMPNFTIGTFFDKGHVVSVATNLTKTFRDEVKKSTELADKIKKNLIDALDVYISRLEDDDLATANMPTEVYQNISGINYTKSADRYVVELQYSVTNRASGRASKAVVEELRKVFTPNSDAIKAAFDNSSTGKMLLTSKSSPSYLDLLAKNIASVIATGKENKQVYSGKLPDISTPLSIKIQKKSNKKLIQQLKKIKSEIAANTPKKVTPRAPAERSLTSLQAFINEHLQSVISANMGDGTRKDILNYRSGRFAASVKVDRLTISREGMITAFYSYMRNPYGTFSEGGRQQMPRSRDPKLLISRSIREIAAEKVANRMRAVLA